MAQPSIYDVHVNTPLSNVSTAYIQKQTQFIASRVFPNVPVLKASDVYYQFNRADFNRDEMQERAPGAQSAGSGYKLSAGGTYNCIVKALHQDIPDQVRANSDQVLNQDLAATRFVTNKALINRETDWVGAYFKTGVWGTDVAGVSASPSGSQFIKWSAYSTSTPVEQVRAAKRTVLQNTGFMPNVLVLSQPVMDALIDHPEIIDRVKYGQTLGQGIAKVNAQSLAQLWELDEVLVAAAVYNTGAKGGAENSQFIAGSNALLCYRADAPDLMTPTAGYTFTWTGYFGANDDGMRIKRFRMEPESSDRVEIESALAHTVVGSDLGYFFSNAA